MKKCKFNTTVIPFQQSLNYKILKVELRELRNLLISVVEIY